MILVAALAVYMGIYWIAGVMALGVVLIAVASVDWSRPSPAPGGGKEEEIITPVVVQDIGEPPYLYPPNFELRVKPNESLMPGYDIAAGSLGKLFRVAVRTIRGDRYSRLPVKKVRWR